MIESSLAVFSSLNINLNPFFFMKKFFVSFVSIVLVFAAIFAAVTDSFAIDGMKKRKASGDVPAGAKIKKVSPEELQEIFWSNLAKTSFEKQNKDRLSELGVTGFYPVVNGEGVFYGGFATVKTKGYDQSLVTDPQLRGVNMLCERHFKIPGTDEQRKTALGAVFRWAGERANRNKVIVGLKVRREKETFIGWTVLYKFGPVMPPPMFAYIPIQPVTLEKGYEAVEPVIVVVNK